MKKTIAMLLAVAMCLTLCACNTDGSKNNTPPDASGSEQPAGSEQNAVEIDGGTLELGYLYEMADYCEFSLVHISTTDKIEGTMGGELCFESSNEGETFVDVALDVTNISAGAINSEDFMKVVAVSPSGTEYEGSLYCVETNGMADVERYGDLVPQEEARFHAAILVPTNERKLTLNFTANDIAFSCDYEVGAEVKTVIDLKEGDIIGDESHAKAKFLGYEFTGTVNPSVTEGYYRYYQVENPENIYLAMKFEITNNQETAKAADSLIHGKAVSADGTEYTGIVASDSADEQGLNENSEIAAQETGIVYCLIEVPKTVSEQTFVASVMFNGQEYTFGK